MCCFYSYSLAIFLSLDICYGFDVMSAQESPNIPFTFFRTRFPKGLLNNHDCIFRGTLPLCYGHFIVLNHSVSCPDSSKYDHLRQLL